MNSYNFKAILFVGLISLSVIGCSNLSPTPYSDALMMPLKLYNERVKITPKKNFRPEKLKKIVVSISKGNIRYNNQGNFISRLESVTTSALLEKGYVVVSRTDENARKAEIEYQSTQKTRGAAADKHAAVTSVLLVVDVTDKTTLSVNDDEDINKKYYENHVSVSVKLLNLQSSVILWIAEANKTKWIKKGLENDLIEHALKDIMSEFPKKK